MNAQPLTAVRVQQMLREVDAELARGKPTAETLCRLLETLADAHRPNFDNVSITSPLTGRGVMVATLWYRLEAALEEEQKAEFERESRRCARTHAAS